MLDNKLGFDGSHAPIINESNLFRQCLLNLLFTGQRLISPARLMAALLLPLIMNFYSDARPARAEMATPAAGQELVGKNALVQDPIFSFL